MPSTMRATSASDPRYLRIGLHSLREAVWIVVVGALCCLGLSGLSLSAQSASAGSAGSIADHSLDARVESILKGMTPEEKVGQLVQYSAGQPTGPGTGRTDYDDMIAHGQIGSLFNVVDPQQINTYQRIAMEKSRLHIPILFGLDVIHGFKTEFPIPLGLASTWDPSIVEKASHVAAMEALPTASAGHFRRWSTLRATRAGVAWRRVREKIRFSVRPWPQLT